MTTVAPAPCFAPLLSEVKKIGCKIVKGWTSKPGSHADRFLLHVPHCGHELVWHVLLDEEDPLLPPDFMFGDKVDVFVSAPQLKSLSKWDISDPASLKEIILELKKFYNEFQKQNIKLQCNDERILFEMETLASINNVEFYYEFDDYGRNEVHCLIPITGLNLSKELPSALNAAQSQSSATEEEKPPSLLIKFSAGNASHPDVKLQIPSLYHEFLSGLPKPPAWSFEMCTLDYVPLVKEHIEEYIKSFYSRRIFFAELAKQFGSPLEYDAVECKKIAFVLDTSSIVIMLTITIPSTWPTDPPAVSLSTMNVASRIGTLPRTIARAVTKYPYSPRWSPEEMAKRLRTTIVETLPTFKKAVEEDSK